MVTKKNFSEFVEMSSASNSLNHVLADFSSLISLFQRTNNIAMMNDLYSTLVDLYDRVECDFINSLPDEKEC